MKLGLGTVQFGCDYGISNSRGKVNIAEISKILDFAYQNNIDTLDTASLYGDSEKVLGQFNLDNFKVVTKTIKLNSDLSKQENLKNFERAFFNSIENLGGIKLYGLMFHESTDLTGVYGEEFWELLKNFKGRGYVDKIGVSVYKPDILEKIINKYDIDLVQLPLNLLDQRFIPYLKTLKEHNIEIHTRSAFLQGLIFMDEEKIPPYFNEIKDVLKSIPEPRLACALQFVNNLREVDRIIVGVTSLKELKEIVISLREKIQDFNFEKFKVENEKFILPQNWRV